MNLEQEVASIIAFAQRNTTDVHSYYWNLPEGFQHPALFFPQPEITTGGETFRTYASGYAWYIKVFAATSGEAHEIALTLLTALKRARNYVPIIDADGQITREALRLKDPSLQSIEDGVEQLTLNWISRRPYDAAEPLKMQTFQLGFYNKLISGGQPYGEQRSAEHQQSGTQDSH